MKKKKLGLVLSGGGARSAYQAGVLLGLDELHKEAYGKSLHLDVICGISGGAINSAFLASRAHDLPFALNANSSDNTAEKNRSPSESVILRVQSKLH